MISTSRSFSDVLAVCRGKSLLAEASRAGRAGAVEFKLCLGIIAFESGNMMEELNRGREDAHEQILCAVYINR